MPSNRQTGMQNHKIDAKAKSKLSHAITNFNYEDYYLFPDQVNVDYGKDYKVQVHHNNFFTGKEFSIQLKGHDKDSLLKTNKKIWSETIEMDHLIQWYNSVEPVFLVVTNINSDQLYYIFMQECIKKNNLIDKTKKTKNIRISIENKILSSEKFIGDILYSFEYMKELNHCSSQKAISNERELYGDLDDRFKGSSINCVII